jgi:cytochrome P450
MEGAMSSTIPVPVGLPLERPNAFDPPVVLAQLRRHRPLSRMIYYPDNHEGWLVTGHELAKEVLADTRFSSAGDRMRSPIPFEGLESTPPPVRKGMFIRMDPPDHTRLRRMLTGVFTVKRMKQLEPRVSQIVSEHLDAMERGTKPADLVQAFALPIPSLVICELLGVPYEDREEFQWNSSKLLSLTTPMKDRFAAVTAIESYLRKLGDAKRANPTDDLLSELAARDDLEPDELDGISTLLLIAGHETTANMLSLGTLALLEHPDQLAALRADASLMPGAVEELLRYLSIIHIGPTRVALEDMELGGETVKAGEYITVSVPASNRDPHKFTDPDNFDVKRHANGHFSFGHGVHQCLGQQLARIEMRIGYSQLFARFPRLRLAVPATEIPLRTDMAIYGVHELPVTW